jgi:hypothetical protein
MKASRLTNLDTTVYTNAELIEMVKRNVLNGDYEGGQIWDIICEIEDRDIEDEKDEMLISLEW